jgi:hypothetical protein
VGRKYFKWTRDAIIRLAEIAPALSNREAAAALGCTVSAVQSKKWELGLVSRRRNKQRREAIEGYMLRYQVNRQKVETIGLNRLEAMSEEARTLLLHMKDRRVRSVVRPAVQAKPKPAKCVPIFTETQRIERMMHLARKVS